MSGASTQTLSTILQEKYLPGIVRQFNDDYPLLKYVRQDADSVNAEGTKAVIALELSLNEGGGFHGETEDVDDSGYPEFTRVEVSLKQMTFRARITYRLMRQAKTTANSFVQGMQKVMSATREGFTLRANQYLWGDGSGTMARVKSTTVGVDRKMKFNRGYGLTDGGMPRQIIRRGMKIHILDTKGYTAGVSADRGYAVVEAVNEKTGTADEIEVTVKTGHTLTGVTAGDYVYIGNTIEGWTGAGQSGDNAPAMGMLGFYDEAVRDTLQGLSPTVTVGTNVACPEWKGTSFTATGAADVLRTMRSAKHELAITTRMGRLNYIISNYKAYEAWASALDQKLEFRNVQKIDGSFEYAVYDGRPWFMDHTCPEYRAFLQPTGSTMSRFAVDDFINFVDQDGNSLHMVPNKTVFDTFLTATYNYGVKRRNNLTQVKGLNF